MGLRSAVKPWRYKWLSIGKDSCLLTLEIWKLLSGKHWSFWICVQYILHSSLGLLFPDHLRLANTLPASLWNWQNRPDTDHRQYSHQEIYLSNYVWIHNRGRPHLNRNIIHFQSFAIYSAEASAEIQARSPNLKGGYFLQPDQYAHYVPMFRQWVQRSLNPEVHLHPSWRLCLTEECCQGCLRQSSTD